MLRLPVVCQKFGSQLQENLNHLFVDCDRYRLAIKPVGNHLICICADTNTGFGHIEA